MFSFNHHNAQNIRVTLNKVYIFLKLGARKDCYLRNERLCERSLLSRALY